MQSIDALGNSTEYHYSALSQQDLVTQPQPVSGQCLPQTQVVYDGAGNESALIDPDGNVTTWAYNAQGQVTQSSQGHVLPASGGSTTFANLTLTAQARTFEVYVQLAAVPGTGWQSSYSVSDSGNGFPAIDRARCPADPLGGGGRTLGTWRFYRRPQHLGHTDLLGRFPAQIALVGYSDYDFYNAAGELTKQIDRDGRAIIYTYNALGQETAENWYASVDSNRNPQGSPTETLKLGLRRRRPRVVGQRPDHWRHHFHGQLHLRCRRRCPERDAADSRADSHGHAREPVHRRRPHAACGHHRRGGARITTS